MIKKNGTRESFNKDKILKGVMLACQKRPISREEIEKFVDKVEQKIIDIGKQEIGTREIGEIVVRELRNFDQVAYIRFASVYRDFRDAGELIKEVSKAINEAEPTAQQTLFD